jgi:hypothetical protein
MTPGPYRTNDAAVRRAAIAEANEPTRTTALPLGIIAITFFMPMVRVCDEHHLSPMHEATRTPGSFLMFTPVFFSAAVLCVAIVYTFAVKRSATRAALISMAWSVLASGVSAIGAIGARDKTWVVFAIAGLSAPLCGFAWSSRGLRRLALLVDAYVFTAFPIVFLVVTSADSYGAYVFVGAYLALASLRLTSRCAAALRAALRERGPARHPAR